MTLWHVKLFHPDRYILLYQKLTACKTGGILKKGTIIFILALVSIAILSGCLQKEKNIDNEKPQGNATAIPESTQELKKFSSAIELQRYLRNISGTGALNTGGVGGEFGLPTVAIKQTAQNLQVATETATDYSTTNIQVAGVDEADFVKNDGKYIYILAEDRLVIIDAFPASTAKILSSTLIQGRPREMFVNGDRLMIFSEDNDRIYEIPEYDYIPQPIESTKTMALIYDIADRSNPVQMVNYSINGNYFQSRMIGDYVYFIAKDYVYYTAYSVEMPLIRKGNESIMSPDVYYFDNPEQNYVFHTIASINIKRPDTINAKTFMMGYSDSMYVSGTNIYITYMKNMPAWYYEQQREERFYEIVVPMLPRDVQDKILSIKNSSLDPYEKWDNISTVLEDAFNHMSEKEQQQYQDNVRKAVEEFDIIKAAEWEKTVIQKIGIEEGNITYKKKGEVQGSLLNQFSMDESGDYFRVATTTQFWAADHNILYNNVYIMNGDLNVSGKLEKIAPDEKIYATRFIGNRLYMVTFMRTDPLFVIDLSDSSNPKILGELKIPGFSDYLHPYDENLIIGVGKETSENDWGGVSIKGVKLSLFNVSDVNNPLQIARYEIGLPGTDSEALRDHKAFLFDKKKNLLVLPIREVMGKEEYDSKLGYYQKIWQGAYVFEITPSNISQKGTISHFDNVEMQYYYWGSPWAVRRSLFMDDVLYTISARKVMMNNLGNISQINSIDLPFSKDLYNVQ